MEKKASLASVPLSTWALLASAAIVMAVGAIVGNTLSGNVNVNNPALTVSIASNTGSPLTDLTSTSATTGAVYNVTIHVVNAATGSVNFVLIWNFTSSSVAATDISIEEDWTGDPVPRSLVGTTSLVFQTSAYTIGPSGTLDFSYALTFNAQHVWSWSIAPYQA